MLIVSHLFLILIEFLTGYVHARIGLGLIVLIESDTVGLSQIRLRPLSMPALSFAKILKYNHKYTSPRDIDAIIGLQHWLNIKIVYKIEKVILTRCAVICSMNLSPGCLQSV